MTTALLMSEAEAAAKLAIRPSALARLRRSGRAPHVLIARRPLYSDADLLRIIEICRQEPTAQPPQVSAVQASGAHRSRIEEPQVFKVAPGNFPRAREIFGPKSKRPPTK